jgi:hypothetical protein
MLAEEPFGSPMFDFLNAFPTRSRVGRMRSSATSSRSVGLGCRGCDDPRRADVARGQHDAGQTLWAVLSQIFRLDM